MTQGTNTPKNDVRAVEGRRASARSRIVPIPPALAAAHPSSARPVAIRNGAESVSSHLMLSVPAHTKYRLMSQNSPKPRYCGRPYPMNRHAPPSACHGGHRMASSALIASPPIHVWIPNQPQATTERSSEGTCAPRTPNAARAYTGKGIP